jgi:hypothetical protein
VDRLYGQASGTRFKDREQALQGFRVGFGTGLKDRLQDKFQGQASGTGFNNKHYGLEAGLWLVLILTYKWQLSVCVHRETIGT